MARGKQPAFWLAIAGISYLTPIVVNLAADRFGQQVPALKTLNDYRAYRNG